jgi:excisionase family DNA binding protein
VATKTDDPSPSDELRLYTIEEAAEILRCGKDYLYSLVHQRIAGHTKIGRRLLFTESHLQGIAEHFERKPVKR